VSEETQPGASMDRKIGPQQLDLVLRDLDALPTFPSVVSGVLGRMPDANAAAWRGDWTPDEELIGVLESNKIFIELCPNLRHSKLNKQFYHFAEGFFANLQGSDVLISIGTDTHTNLKNVGDIADALDFIARFGLEDNLITKLF